MTTTLDTYRTLGRSGLRVSRLALGTATFGTEWGWGADREDARRLFDRYVDAGGNFLDTASTYTEGTSERYLGEFARGRRDSLVIATKYSTLRRPGDPNSGGGHRKNLLASVDASLDRLGTDHVDLLHLHVWDDSTPVDEILRGMDDLVRQGKVLHCGISSAPAWQIARMQTIADLRGWRPLIALQVEHNLIERRGELDLFPMARELGLGVVPFSPLAGGVLTGRYRTRSAGAAPQDGTRTAFNVGLGAVTDRSLSIADVVGEVAEDLGVTPSQVALAWSIQNPHVTAPIIGARTPAQLEENLAALAVDLDTSHLTRLEGGDSAGPGLPACPAGQRPHPPTDPRRHGDRERAMTS
ncbi:aldo/keto reductase [Williamsia deligens]|uniref:Aldo/keto reductase n=1 Tax=Williamsia deligens TaxID=321325 RepID=A0ABW3G4X4_9NOCA|nr:aldo/keto reductase [Williamsia deligens]MCP2193562.1 putative oxidoreductase [Williamsia deligens]